LDIQNVESDSFASLVVDVSNPDLLLEKINEVILKEGRVDHLICSAGIWDCGSIEDTSVEQFDRIVNINIRGTFFSMKGVIPQMKLQKSGSIIVVASDQSLIGKSGQ